MSKVELVIVDATAQCTIYTIHFLSETKNEFQRFYAKFKDNLELYPDLMQITKFVHTIGEMGALERYFRPEGKMSDNVWALPITKSQLRLYCLRLSDKMLILGNGGIKNTRTYDENSELNGYVLTLQKFEKIIKEGVQEGSISITKNKIIPNKPFDL